jgi:hypothetical protein
MKKILFLLLLLPLLGKGLGGGLLFAQTATVSNLLVTEGTPTTVTFNVSWEQPASTATLWKDSAWVFVDYNNAGRMTRLKLSGGTLTYHTANTAQSPDAGKLIKLTGNDRGAWVTGDARTSAAGSFSATVQLLTATQNIAGACVYASGYPPVGAWVSDEKITFTGTPVYEVTLMHTTNGSTVTVESDATFLLPCDYTIDSFTDKTGAPGIFNCIPPATYSLSGTNVCVGAAVNLTLSGSQSGWKYQLYNGNTPVGSAQNGTDGSPLIFTDTPATDGEYSYTVRTVDGSSTQCNAPVNSALNITIHPYPANLTLTPNPATICAGQQAVLMATATHGTQYRLDNGVWQYSPTFYVYPTANTSYTLSVQTAAGCSVSITDLAAVEVNQQPEVPMITALATTVCQGTDVVFTATGSAGSTFLWSGTTGVASGEGNGTYTVSGTSTGTKSVSAYARVTSNGATCQSNTSAPVSAVVATVPNVPNVIASAATVCQGTNVAFRATGTSGAVYTWLGTPGTVSGTGSGTYTVSGATAEAKSVSAYASLTSSGTTCQSSTSDPVSAIVATMPDVPTIIASASTVCQNTDIVFEVETPVSGESYTWTGTAGTASGAGSYSFTVSGSSTGTKSKSVTARLASSGTTCVSANAATVTAVVATVPANPAITRVTSASTVCQGTDISYRVTSVGSNVTYTWSGTPGTVSGASNNTYTVSGATTGTKSVTLSASLASSGTVCPASASASISTVVATMPDVPTIIASASTVCQYTNIVFEVQSPVSGESYTWTGTAGTASGAGSYSFTVSGSSTGAKTKSVYARFASSGTTCQSANAATVTAVVATTPAGPAITRVTLPSASTVCQGPDITYRVTSLVTGATYVWTGTPGTASGTSSNTYTVSGATTGTKSVTVTATLASSGTVCPSTMTASISTVVATTPDVPTIITSASTVCQNTNVVFEVQSPKSGETYTWTGTSGTASGTGSYTLTVSGATTGNKSVGAYARLTSSGTTCQSATAATVPVVVAAVPTMPAITRVSAATVCQGTDIVFRVSTLASGVTYTWSGAEGVASGTRDGTYTVSSATTGNKSVTVYATSSGTVCPSNTSAAASAVVATMPTVSVTASASTVCKGTDVVFTATGNASSYSWGGTSGTASGANNYIFTVDNNYSSSVPRTITKTVYAYLASSGTTCVKIGDPVSAYVRVPTNTRQGVADEICGCAPTTESGIALVNCGDGICRSTCNILASCNLTAISPNNDATGVYPNAVAGCNNKGADWVIPTYTEMMCLCVHRLEMTLVDKIIDGTTFWTSTADETHPGHNKDVQLQTPSDVINVCYGSYAPTAADAQGVGIMSVKCVKR